MVALLWLEVPALDGNSWLFFLRFLVSLAPSDSRCDPRAASNSSRFCCSGANHFNSAVGAGSCDDADPVIGDSVVMMPDATQRK